MKFTFDAESHTYRINDEVVPSITGIIKPLVNYSMIPPAVLQKAADYGTAVHKAIELFVGERLDMESLDPALRQAVEQYQLWYEETGHFDLPVCELPMGHERQKWAGTPDLIFDGRAIVELKTRKTNRLTDSIQLAAQEQLWIANGGEKGPYTHHVLELLPGQPHKLVTFDKKEIKEGWARFRYLRDFHAMNANIQAWGK